MKKWFHRPRRSTVIFYSLCLAVIVAFCLLMGEASSRLTDYLARYEASHIGTRYQEEFDRLFAEPDWATLYDQAGCQDTLYENRDTYAAYMEEKVGSQTLQCFIESAGTSGKKCPVYLGDEQIAVFYMAAAQATDHTPRWYDDIPLVSSFVNSLKIEDWKLDGLELFFDRQESVTVCTGADRTVLVNGVALSQEQVIHTWANYLTGPDGEIPTKRRQTLRLDGLLVAPTVTVTDPQGQPVPMEYDPQTQSYTEVFSPNEITQEEKTALVAAAKTYCQFMIRAAYWNDLDDHFDTSSDIYQSILSIETWMLHYVDYRYTEPVITDYFRFSEDAFCARLAMTMLVDCRDGTVQERPLETTFYFQKDRRGVYKVVDMTNASVMRQEEQVLLRFFDGSRLIGSFMVDAHAREVTLPQVEVPAGKAFAGWFQSQTGSDGSQIMTLVFAPKDGSLTVYIPENTTLAPMDLQARFE